MLDMVFRMVGIDCDIDTVDKIIDLVELIEDKGTCHEIIILHCGDLNGNPNIKCCRNKKEKKQGVLSTKAGTQPIRTL